MDHSDKGLTRRDFTKVAAGAAASFAILSGRPGKADANVDTLKVGLLGCGGRGTSAAINILEGDNNVQLVAMADVFADRLNSSRERIKNSEKELVAKGYAVEDDHCFTGLDAYEKILQTDIDILLEATLPYSRSIHLLAAAKAGKHIFTEKPVAVDPTGIRRVLEAAKICEEKKKCVVAGTQRRHHRPYMETIKKLHDGAIGEIVALRAYWCGTLPFCHDRKPGWTDLEYRLRNWINYCWTSGDNIVEQHIHNLDVCNWVMNGHPVSVLASGGRVWKPREEKYGDLWDNFSCDYEYPNGVHMASFSRHWDGCAENVSEAAVGTKGKSTCRDLAPGVDETSGYIWEHRDLVAAIRGNAPYLNELQRVAESTMTAIMGRMAAYSGKLVTWDDALNSDLSIVPDVVAWDRPYPVGPIPIPVDKSKY